MIIFKNPVVNNIVAEVTMTLILIYFYYSRGLTLQSPCLKSNGKAKNGKKSLWIIQDRGVMKDVPEEINETHFHIDCDRAES